jgi:hypothetical protein
VIALIVVVVFSAVPCWFAFGYATTNSVGMYLPRGAESVEVNIVFNSNCCCYRNVECWIVGL